MFPYIDIENYSEHSGIINLFTAYLGIYTYCLHPSISSNKNNDKVHFMRFCEDQI